jgi:hypothetical protein
MVQAVSASKCNKMPNGEEFHLQVQKQTPDQDVFQLSIEMVVDQFSTRSSNSMAPYYDVVSLMDFRGLVCIRPNNVPRGDVAYFLNHFIHEKKLQIN